MSDEIPDQVTPERWDASEKKLVWERKEILPENLGDLDIGLNTGRIIIQAPEEGESPSILTRVSVSAASENDARQVMGKENKFRFSKTNTSVTLEDESEGSFGGIGTVVVGGGNVVVGGRIFVGGDFVGGDLIINGRRVKPESLGGVSAPEKEVIIKAPQKELSYNLRNLAGNIRLERGSGQADLTTQSGRIEIGEFDGELRLDSKSGKVTIKRLSGELGGNLTSGDVRIGSLEGRLNLNATSGDIYINDLVVEGRSSRINATSGDIKLGISNKSLRVRANTMSGDIGADKGRFKVTKESKRKGSGVTVIRSGNSVVSIGGGGGGSNLEGYYGEDPSNAPELTITATSGDVDFSHTNREADPKSR